MVRKIKVHIFGRNGLEMKELEVDEAQAMLNAIFEDALGGLVINRRTGQVISEIGPDVEEVLILDMAVGGG